MSACLVCLLSTRRFGPQYACAAMRARESCVLNKLSRGQCRSSCYRAHSWTCSEIVHTFAAPNCSGQIMTHKSKPTPTTEC